MYAVYCVCRVAQNIVLLMICIVHSVIVSCCVVCTVFVVYFIIVFFIIVFCALTVHSEPLDASLRQKSE